MKFYFLFLIILYSSFGEIVGLSRGPTCMLSVLLGWFLMSASRWSSAHVLWLVVHVGYWSLLLPQEWFHALYPVHDILPLLLLSIILRTIAFLFGMMIITRVILSLLWMLRIVRVESNWPPLATKSRPLTRPSASSLLWVVLLIRGVLAWVIREIIV